MHIHKAKNTNNKYQITNKSSAAFALYYLWSGDTSDDKCEKESDDKCNEKSDEQREKQWDIERYTSDKNKGMFDLVYTVTDGLVIFH